MTSDFENTVLDNDEVYKQISLRHDPLYDHIVATTDIVKQFIRKNNFIIYGGTAIDFALRIQGDKIYPDDSLSTADLDFFSPDSVVSAYNLVDMLYDSGYVDTRTIVAKYVRTMRVDMGDNHFIADISYMPPEIFHKLQYLTYDGMRIVHPDFQRIDMHSSLSFPYDEAPMEVIFSRWRKDVSRLLLLDKYYPINDVSDPVMQIVEITTSISLNDSILTGYAAFAIIWEEYCKWCNEMGEAPPPAAFRLKYRIQDNLLVYESPINNAEYVNFSLDKIDYVEHYEPYINMVPEYVVVRDSGAKVYLTSHRLVAMNSAKIDGVRVRITNVQYVLKHFMGMFIATGNVTYRAFYSVLWNAIKRLTVRNCDDVPPLMRLSATTYGFDNYSYNYQVSVSYINRALGRGDVIPMPKNWKPAVGARPDPYDYDSVEFFRERGLPVKNK